MLLVHNKRKLKLGCKFHIRNILHKDQVTILPCIVKTSCINYIFCLRENKDCRLKHLERLVDTKILTLMGHIHPLLTNYIQVPLKKKKKEFDQKIPPAHPRHLFLIYLELKL